MPRARSLCSLYLRLYEPRNSIYPLLGVFFAKQKTYEALFRSFLSLFLTVFWGIFGTFHSTGSPVTGLLYDGT